jgi:hypothetical protein
VSSQANVVKELIDRGLPPVQADMKRFFAGLTAMTAASDIPSASARAALRAARDHATAAQQALLHANSGHILLVQGGAQAVRGFKYLADGLTSLLHGVSSTGATASRDIATARALFVKSGSEFLKADRALGCPYGCEKPKVVPIP